MASEFFIEEQAFLLPNAPGCLGIQVRFDVAAYEDALFPACGFPFPPFLEIACPGRRAEFLAGRRAAQRALCGLAMAPADVGVGRHRSPIWPPPAVGSITHRGALALCLMAHRSAYRSLGIDLEEWIPEAIAAEIRGAILQPDEIRLLADLPMEPCRGLTLAFSAKECLFKALYPFVREHFDFQAARVVEVDPRQNRLLLTMTRTLAYAIPAGATYEAGYVPKASGVLTFMALRA